MKHNAAARNLAIAAAALALGVVGSGPATATELAQPLAPLEAYLGHWQCDGTMFASPAGPAHGFAARYEVAADLGGRWVAARYTETVTDAHPVAFDHLELGATTRRRRSW